ncbi:MAG: hypothetical protein R3298_07950 [Gammaproteobacteria bacterium]|nr:hypothetical protein [Gammaproteobacteria bacterium]
MPEPRLFNRWLVVAGAILVQLALGAIYAWSVFTPALRAAGWSKLDTQVVFAISLATFAVVMVWAGRKLPKWGPNRLAVAAGRTHRAGDGRAGRARPPRGGSGPGRRRAGSAPTWAICDPPRP